LLALIGIVSSWRSIQLLSALLSTTNVCSSGLHYELGLPQSGIDSFEVEVPFPTFIGSDHQIDVLSNEVSHYRMHFLSQIALRRVCGSIHLTLYDSKHDGLVICLRC
jgi:hypothetical protein